MARKSHRFGRRAFVGGVGGAGLLLLTALAGCGKQAGQSQAGTGTGSLGSQAAHSRLRIGYQKGGALHLLRVNGALDKRLAKQGVTVEWLQFPSAPPMLEGVGVGSIDIGSGGDAPIIFAQAAGYPVVLLANTPPGSNSSRAVIVPKDSPLRSLGELRGKRIAVSKGTGTHNYLIQVLERAGVPYSAITPVYLAPPDARAAFDAGRVDAWAAWDPYLTAATHNTGARKIATGAGIVSAGGFYFASRTFAQTQPGLIRATLEEVDKAGIYLWQHPHDAAVQLAPHMGVDVATLEALNRNAQQGRQYVGFRPVDSTILQAQQSIADNFYRIGLLPEKVNARDALLTPAEYARFLPPPRTTTTVAQGGTP